MPNSDEELYSKQGMEDIISSPGGSFFEFEEVPRGNLESFFHGITFQAGKPPSQFRKVKKKTREDVEFQKVKDELEPRNKRNLLGRRTKIPINPEDVEIAFNNYMDVVLEGIASEKQDNFAITYHINKLLKELSGIEETEMKIIEEIAEEYKKKRVDEAEAAKAEAEESAAAESPYPLADGFRVGGASKNKSKRRNKTKRKKKSKRRNKSKRLSKRINKSKRRNKSIKRK